MVKLVGVFFSEQSLARTARMGGKHSEQQE